MINYEPLRDVENKVSLNSYEGIIAPMHFHRSIELIFVMRGKLMCQIGERSYEVNVGEILFVPSFYPHAITKNICCQFMTLILPYNSYKQLVTESGELCFSHLNSKLINDKLFTLLNAINDELHIKGYSNVVVKSYVSIMLMTIARGYEQDNKLVYDNQIMIDIINYVEENYKDKITLSDIANHFKYSKYHFSRLFNKLFDCNLNFYINQVRYGYIMQQSSGEKKFSALILDNGFQDISMFYKFKAQLKKSNII